MNNTPSARTPSRTPRRGGDPSSARRSAAVHTPLDRSAPRQVLNSVRRGLDPASAGKKNNAPTPHAKAARLALSRRRTQMFTPGKNRRKSLMQERETPMGILRNLSRALAPASQPIPSSSSSPGSKEEVDTSREEYNEEDDLYDDGDDDDDDLPIDRPRLSLPLDDDDNDDFEDDLRPPRLSQVDDENFTVQSIELARRFSEAPSRLSRGSFGSEGASNMYNPDLTGEINQQSDFFPNFLEDLQAREDTDPSLERFDPDQTRRMTLGHESFNLDMPVGIAEDQTTFLMSSPGAEVAHTSPIPDQSTVHAVADEAHHDPAPDVVPGESDSDAGAGGLDFDNEGFDYDVGGFDDHSSIMEEQEPPRPEPEPEHEPTQTTLQMTSKAKTSLKARKKQKRISKHGVEYPALPPSFVKRVAQTALQSSGLGNQRISPDTLEALSQASEWFFEQLGDDLGAYANHAKRKTIEESDVFTLMKRQRQVGSRSTVFSLAQRHLPRELIQELRMPVPQPVKQRRAKRTREDEEEVTEYT